ncbi:MAG: hypothetical protein HOM11_10550 [Methylococcales bacterium]|jgi:hypothetical protein|nr:hypothetical protein [Methylococcales bacterium]MBT7443258.1 hypothetical protein [Methylococcales bacterium]
MIKMLSIVCLSLMLSQAYAICEYEDDYRLLSQESVNKLVAAIQEGERILPIKMTLKTYLSLGEKSTQTLKPHAVILGVDCREFALYESQLTGIVSVPFYELYRVYANALKNRNRADLLLLNRYTAAAPMHEQEYFGLYGAQAPAQDGGRVMQEKIMALFPLIKEYAFPVKKAKLLERDFRMLKLFRVFGGQFIPNCKAFNLPKNMTSQSRRKKYGISHQVERVFEKALNYHFEQLTPPKLPDVKVAMKECR